MQATILKAVSAAFLILIMISMVVMKHFWTNVNIDGINEICLSGLTALGVYHATLKNPKE